MLTAGEMTERLHFIVQEKMPGSSHNSRGMEFDVGQVASMALDGGWEAHGNGCKIHWKQEITHYLVQEKSQTFQDPCQPTCCHHKRWGLSTTFASRRYSALYLLSKNGCALSSKLPEPSMGNQRVDRF